MLREGFCMILLFCTFIRATIHWLLFSIKPVFGARYPPVHSADALSALQHLPASKSSVVGVKTLPPGPPQHPDTDRRFQEFNDR